MHSVWMGHGAGHFKINALETAGNHCVLIKDIFTYSKCLNIKVFIYKQVWSFFRSSRHCPFIVKLHKKPSNKRFRIPQNK